MKKWILRLVVLVILLFIVAIAALSFNLNRLVKHAIQDYGPRITQVAVGIDSVVLLPLSGIGRLGGLELGNPAGYSAPHAITVGGASVSIDTGTIMDEKIVIRSINISDPEVTLEGGLRDNNLTRILDNIDSYSKRQTKGPADESEDGASKKLQIDSLKFTGAKVNLAIPLLKGKTTSVPLQDIELTGLGQGPEGVTAAEVSEQLIDQILAQTTAIIPQLLAGVSLENLDVGVDLAKEAGKLGIDTGKLGLPFGKKSEESDGQTADGAAKGIGKGAENITEGVGGLLKGLKKKN